MVLDFFKVHTFAPSLKKMEGAAAPLAPLSWLLYECCLETITLTS